MIPDTVVAIVSEESLPDLLTQVHRSGFGQNARVLRPRRSPLREQLRRAGISIEQAPERLDAAACLLTILAAGRSPAAADLALHHGASATWIVTRSGAWNLVDDRILPDATGQKGGQAIPAPVAVLQEEPSDVSGSI
ncbi:MAG TPA: hypothetical protein VGR29_02290 [Thermomicrobiales bacterium]|nr:hypothetical protein [Thermomicrobiales bacterium]